MVAEPRAAGAQKEKSTRPAARRRPGSPKGPGAAAPNSRWNPVSRGGAQTAGEAPGEVTKLPVSPRFPCGAARCKSPSRPRLSSAPLASEKAIVCGDLAVKRD